MDSKEQSTSSPSNERIELNLISLGKRMKLDLSEMNELRVVDLIEMSKIYYGKNEDKPKDATQDDIDKFYR